RAPGGAALASLARSIMYARTDCTSSADRRPLNDDMPWVCSAPPSTIDSNASALFSAGEYRRSGNTPRLAYWASWHVAQWLANCSRPMSIVSFEAVDGGGSSTGGGGGGGAGGRTAVPP